MATSCVGDRTAPAVCLAAPCLFPRSLGQAQSRQSLIQSPHLGLISSHFFLRRLHIKHPVWTRRMRALGISANAPTASDASSEAPRGRQGKLRRVHRPQGVFPSQACLIWAQRWHTGRSTPMVYGGQRRGVFRRSIGLGGLLARSIPAEVVAECRWGAYEMKITLLCEIHNYWKDCWKMKRKGRTIGAGQLHSATASLTV